MKERQRAAYLRFYENGPRSWFIGWLSLWAVTVLFNATVAWFQHPTDRPGQIMLVVISHTITCTLFGFLTWYLLERFYVRNKPDSAAQQAVPADVARPAGERRG